MQLLVRLLVAGLLLAAPAYSQKLAGEISAAPFDYEAVRLTKIATAIRIAERISLDGRLEEPAWSLALPATNFVQLSPRPGELALNQTEIRVLFDEANLYVGVTCLDTDPDHIIINDLTDDFNFGQSDAINVILDTLHDGRSGFMFMTNAAGARRDGQIFNDGANLNIDWDGVWDVKVTRNSEGWIAEFMIPFKTLRFSTASTQEWGLNVTRAVRRVNEESHWAPVPVRYRPTRVSLSGTLRGFDEIGQGLNLKVKPSITTGVTRTRIDDQMKTIRSFGDSEFGVDVKYSLTPSLTLDATYNTDFAQVEVDQQQVNLTRFNLFFPEKRDFFLENSGTFGFGPGGNLVPFFSRRIGLSAAGTPIPIIGGARVSGQVNKYDVGFLAMKTERQDLTPSNNYLVGRVKRNLLKNSWMGALVTSRDSTTAGDYNRVYGADAHFQFFDRLDFDSYLLQSDTPGASGRNQARRFETGWRDDELTVVAQYNQVQTNFNPEVGFIRRRDNTQYAGEFSWNPLLRNSEMIRNLIFGTNLDYYEGGSGKVETRTQDVNMGVLLRNDASANFTITRTFDRLASPTRLQGIALPAADYKYLGYAASFNTDGSEKISGSSTINWGEFWNGHRQSFHGSLNLKPHYRFNVALNYDRNHLDLMDGRSKTNLVGSRLVYAFSPRSFLNTFLQYNGDTHEVSTNIRFSLMYRPLSHLYVVYNDRRNTNRNEVMDRAFIVKLTNLFSF